MYTPIYIVCLFVCLFAEGDEDESGDDEEQPELEKEMGDLDGQDADKLDEQIWGSDDEDEDDKVWQPMK